jgi:hypothetical protein
MGRGGQARRKKGVEMTSTAPTPLRRLPARSALERHHEEVGGTRRRSDD